MKNIIILTALTGLAACATQKLDIQSDAGATCKISNDKNNLTIQSPASVQVYKGLNNLEIACSKDGKQGKIILPPVDNGVSGVVQVKLQ